MSFKTNEKSGLKRSKPLLVFTTLSLLFQTSCGIKGVPLPPEEPIVLLPREKILEKQQKKQVTKKKKYFLPSEVKENVQEQVQKKKY